MITVASHNHIWREHPYADFYAEVRRAQHPAHTSDDGTGAPLAAAQRPDKALMPVPSSDPDTNGGHP